MDVIRNVQKHIKLLPTYCLSVLDHFVGLALKLYMFDRVLNTPLIMSLGQYTKSDKVTSGTSVKYVRRIFRKIAFLIP